jgi:DNA-binding NarL/FixJ family response regulator
VATPEVPSLTHIRVLIVAASPLARAGLAGILGQIDDIDVIGQTDGEALAGMLSVYRPHILIWDMGYEAARAVDQIIDLPSSQLVPILALIAPPRGDDADIVDRLLGGMSAYGVRGILPHNSGAHVIAGTLRALADELIVLHPSVVTTVFERAFNQQTDAAASQTVLTPREREVLHLIAEGLPNKAIALQLRITEHTVKFHINAILTKLGAQSRTEAVVRATRLGLIAL